eukprot:458928-Pelagomonas_calceolata.AAC.2
MTTRVYSAPSICSLAANISSNDFCERRIAASHFDWMPSFLQPDGECAAKKVDVEAHTGDVAPLQ